VVDAQGAVLRSLGDIDRSVLARSASKALWALPLIESGAADAAALSDAEIALACGSQIGRPEQTAAIAAWLRRLGLDVSHLECGIHPPFCQATRSALLREGQAFTALHHNSAGKHAGFLTTALHLGEPLAGYTRAAHPVQRRLLGVLEEMTALDLARAPRGVDGCGMPLTAVPLRALAYAMARFGAPAALAAPRRCACERICAALRAHPEMVVGPGRLSSEIIRATAGRVLAKGGAEGVFTAFVPHLAIGVALKIDDGANRAADVAILAILDALGALAPREREALQRHLEPVLHAGSERVVAGSLRPRLAAFGAVEHLRRRSA
jgi:L-asparaginase II